MKRILVIEDDQDIADIVEMALNHKYTIQTETNNQQILAAYKEFTPDMILVDNFIGQKKAAEIVQEIKDTDGYKNIPFVLFSGHHNIKNLAEEIEATAYISKPFDLVDFHQCIDKVMAQCA